jgi:OPT oligopeptide transporter protein
MPIGGRGAYDRFGKSYKVAQILDATGRRFDLDKYHAYSAMYLPGPYAMVYLVAFALSTALLVHTILYHARTVYNGIKRVQIEEDDVHAKLMRVYPEVPDSWYATICLVFFIAAIVSVEVWPTQMPVWALALAVLLPTIYLLPCGFIFAVTGQGASINLIAEILPGVLLSGRPLANMVRRSLSMLPFQFAKKYRKKEAD